MLGGSRFETGGAAPVAQAGIVLPAPERLAEGDLVFRRGRDLMSRVVLSQGQDSRYSHVGMIVREERRLYVIHAMPDEGGVPGGVRQQALEDFIAPEVAADAVVYRMQGLTAARRTQVRDYLLSRLGTPFDDDFRLGDDSRLYCTELAIKALWAAGLEPAFATHQAFLLAEAVVPPDYLRQAGGMLPVEAGADAPLRDPPG